MKQEPTPANKVDSEVPAEIADIIDRLLEKDPDDRYQSAAELIEDLDSVLAPASKRGLMIGGIITATVVAGGALIYALTRPEPKDPKTIENEKQAAAWMDCVAAATCEDLEPATGGLCEH